MTNNNARVEELFFEALALRADERERFLARTCGANVDLHREVAGLLVADTRASGFLESPLPGESGALAGLATEDPAGERHVGRRIGPYKLTRTIGTGGMGMVYLATRVDGAFDHQVAIKLLRHSFHHEESLRRFDSERRVLARLEHPSIARLIDGGTSQEGHPYLVMEYVDGVPLDQYCRENRVPVAQRLDLFRKVCSAVDYAHRNLIVHRDLKPGNILVNSRGQVKLLDFGIAKILQSDTEEFSHHDHTSTEFRALTPRYASPEHIGGQPVTTGSDVYSLGVILYELLAEVPPFSVAGKSPGDVLKAIQAGPAKRPSEHVGGIGLRGDLDNIVLKAMRPDLERRYASAEQLSEDIRRYLSGLPVFARPDTWRYRSQKFVQRNRVAVAAAVIAVAVLVAASVGGVVLTMRANRARDVARNAQIEAETQRAAAEQINSMLRDMLASIDPVVAQGRDVTLMREVLDHAVSRIDLKLAGQPLVAADLYQTIGTTYQSLALYSEAEAQLEKALELRRANLSAGDSLIAVNLLFLGQLQEDKSDLTRSEAYYRQAYQEALAAHGRRHPQTALTYMHVAKAYQIKGEADSAEAIYKDVLALQREILPPNHEDLGATLNNYGEFLIHQRPEEAEPLLREALAIHRVFAPPLVLAYPMHNLASWLRRHEQSYAESETLFREEIAILRSHLAPNHPRLAVAVNNLAGVLEASSQDEAAEAAYREALAIQQESLGRDHVDYGTTCNNLARFLGKRGNHEESEALFHEAVQAYEAALGKDHIWVGIVLGNQAQLLEAQERWKEADSVAARCIAIRSKVWDESHWRTASIVGIRGACAAHRGEFESAEATLQNSLAIVEQGVAGEHEELRLALARLEDLYTLWGKPGRAEEYRNRSAVLSKAP